MVRMAISDDADHLGEKYPGIAFCEISFLFKPAKELGAFAVAV